MIAKMSLLVICVCKNRNLYRDYEVQCDIVGAIVDMYITKHSSRN